MKIVMISDSYYPYISGVTRAVSTLKDTLLRMGHSVSLYCPAYPQAEQEEGVTRLPSLRSPTNATYYVALPPFFGLRRAIAGTRPDVIHIHSPFNLSKAGYSIGRRLGIPVVMTYHTMYNLYSHYVPVAGKRFSQTVERMAFRVAKAVDAVVTPSSVLADYLRSQGMVTPLFPLPNGIPVESFQGGDRNYARERYGIPKDLPVIVSCGRLGIEKNIEVLLRAFAAVRAKRDAAILLVGDGPLREHLRNLSVSLGVGDRTFSPVQSRRTSCPTCTPRPTSSCSLPSPTRRFGARRSEGRRIAGRRRRSVGSQGHGQGWRGRFLCANDRTILPGEPSISWRTRRCSPGCKKRPERTRWPSPGSRGGEDTEVLRVGDPPLGGRSTLPRLAMASMYTSVYMAADCSMVALHGLFHNVVPNLPVGIFLQRPVKGSQQAFRQ